MVHLWRAGACRARRDALAPDAILSVPGSGLVDALSVRGRLFRRGSRPVVAAARQAEPTPHDASGRKRSVRCRFRRDDGELLRVGGARCLGFGFVGQMAIDETPPAAAARSEILGLRVGHDDELRALAAGTSQERWFHGTLPVMVAHSHARTDPFMTGARRLRNLPSTPEGLPRRARLFAGKS
jgi:hypothetical protein